MTGALRKSRPNRMSRRKNSQVNRPQPTAPINITDAQVSGSAMTVTFDQPVTVKGIPNYTTDVAGAVPETAQMVDPMNMVLTFDASVAAATEVTIPYEDLAVRNISGGFVSPMTVSLAA